MGRTSIAFGAVVLVAGIAAWTGQAITKSPSFFDASAEAEPLQLAELSGNARPVVVELFTSQGCSSCPPADALLDELADRPGLLALSFHVDYWDYIGWKDPFASAEYTQRQRDYARTLGLRYVYTPQIVVDGRKDLVGSHRRAVTEAIEEAAKRKSVVDVTLAPDDGGKVSLSAGHAPAEGATVYLVMFDDDHKTDVARGENGGRSIHNANVVREYRKLGRWTGEAMEFSLDIAAARGEGRGGCAVIVQAGTTGPVLGAAILDLDTTS
ncbi:DUF1223 domain-containing protein [Pelagibius litoralis]|uniref:DUF1223 domain-containing protein n=1 Tax=Pelagibius litoralis TaxID=374515 RepID=A0A967KF53_9PROT|nr:DUF1223 domain-containing protein [Pelagibius litoralis]NIA71100.1 DUF1223 domain-containing protein [Pelagibius litoralis]